MDSLGIGKSLRIARASKGLSLQKLADLSGISAGGLWQIEMGKKSPRVETLQRLSVVLEIESWRIVRHAHRHNTLVRSVPKSPLIATKRVQ